MPLKNKCSALDIYLGQVKLGNVIKVFTLRYMFILPMWAHVIIASKLNYWVYFTIYVGYF